MSAPAELELVFRDLVFAYGAGEEQLLALDGVSGSVRPGELVSILGPNGAGKSTLLRVLDGLESPASGEVHLSGRALANFDHKSRARALAFVPQFLAHLPEVHVGDFVLGGRYAHLAGWGRRATTDRAAVDAALAACDATGLEGRLLTSLSGGQRQRVLIARALAQEAPVLLVDEPTSSLDPAHQLAIFELLAALAESGRAVLVVTHDLNLASQFSRRILLMKDGREVASGRPDEVLRPEVLRPVYGDGLVFGAHPDATGQLRPFVLSWRQTNVEQGGRV